MTFAPSDAAVFTLAARSESRLEFASTSRILQFWQIWWAVSTSRAISSAHPASLRGRGLGCPFWLSFWKQLVVMAWVQVGNAGRPNVLLYVSRSALAVGSS